jgi:hypothetical protein
MGFLKFVKVVHTKARKKRATFGIVGWQKRDSIRVSQFTAFDDE